MGSHVHAGPGSQRRLEFGEETAPFVQTIHVEALRLTPIENPCVCDGPSDAVIITLPDIFRGLWKVYQTAWCAQDLYYYSLVVPIMLKIPTRLQLVQRAGVITAQMLLLCTRLWTPHQQVLESYVKLFVNAIVLALIHTVGSQRTIQSRGSFLQRGTVWQKNRCAHKPNLAWQCLGRRWPREGAMNKRTVPLLHRSRGQKHKDRLAGGRENDGMGCKRPVRQRHSQRQRAVGRCGYTVGLHVRPFPSTDPAHHPRKQRLGPGMGKRKVSRPTQPNCSARGSFPRRRPGPQSAY